MLVESCALQRFLADASELRYWIKATLGRITMVSPLSPSTSPLKHSHQNQHQRENHHPATAAAAAGLDQKLLQASHTDFPHAAPFPALLFFSLSARFAICVQFVSFGALVICMCGHAACTPSRLRLRMMPLALLLFGNACIVSCVEMSLLALFCDFVFGLFRLLDGLHWVLE
jgi:hypothetical protein